MKRWIFALAMLEISVSGTPHLETTTNMTAAVLTLPASLTKESSCQDFVDWNPPRSQPAVVLQVVSEEYLHLELNFIYHMELHSTFTRHNLYIMCLDEESSTFLMLELGINCANARRSGKHRKREDVWRLRLRAASCLLLAGHDVLLSDADAIWLKDPMENIVHGIGANDSNVVASRGRVPKILYEKWGSTACFGFVLFRAGGTGMPLLVDSMAIAMSRLKDDQRAVNRALSTLGIAWDPTSDMEFETSTRRGKGTVESLADGDKEFVVTLLPHTTFTRLCDKTPLSNDTVVAHCFSTEKGESMNEWMKKNNIWVDFDSAHRHSLP